MASMQPILGEQGNSMRDWKNAKAQRQADEAKQCDYCGSWSVGPCDCRAIETAKGEGA